MTRTDFTSLKSFTTEQLWQGFKHAGSAESRTEITTELSRRGPICRIRLAALSLPRSMQAAPSWADLHGEIAAPGQDDCV